MPSRKAYSVGCFAGLGGLEPLKIGWPWGDIRYALSRLGFAEVKFKLRRAKTA